MGRKKNGEAAPKPAASNGYDPEVVKNIIARVEGLNADKASIMGTAMAECKDLTAEIADILDEAKDKHGIPKKIVRAAVKARALERKAAAVRENLEADDQDQLDLFRHALGDLADTPIGEDDRDLRPPFLQEKAEA